MDPDLQALLVAWTGGEVEDSHRAELLARLRTDPGFRAAAAAEVRMLGMLRAVQSAEPRWLALGDELGWAANEPDGAPGLEDRVMAQLRDEPRRRRSVRTWAALAAGLLLAIVPAWLLLRDGPPQPGTGREAAPSYVAVVVKVDDAQTDGTDTPVPAEGKPLPAGPFRLRSGQVTMTLYSGVMLSVEGPASLDLTSVDSVTCQRGRLRARVPSAAAGFVVRTPGAMIGDVGSEVGVNVDADGRSEVMVFDGRAEVSVLDGEGRTVRSELLEGRRAVAVEPATGRVRDLAPAPEVFLSAPVLTVPTLLPGPGYADEVRRARPWGYWRFEDMTTGVVRNEVPGRPVLRATGPLKLAGVAGANRAVEFPHTRVEQHLIMDDSWAPPRGTGYAVEAWVLPEEVSMGTLVSLTSRTDEPAQKHVYIMELAGRGHHLVHDPCVARYLDRWPPSHGGGVNVFSREKYVPYRWHHLVTCRLPDRLELYMNGELVGSTSADPGDPTTPCRVMLGRLKHGAQPGIDQERPFVGRLDEVAVYDHPLTPEEVRRHYELGAGGSAPGR
jgi:hypothetical protein